MLCRNRLSLKKQPNNDRQVPGLLLLREILKTCVIALALLSITGCSRPIDIE